ncbi:hypothetical protein GCM10027203_29710 [Nonomuraea fastidiosa]
MPLTITFGSSPALRKRARRAEEAEARTITTTAYRPQDGPMSLPALVVKQPPGRVVHPAANRPSTHGPGETVADATERRGDRTDR